MKRVLVTGGAGYIGSHTVVELLQAGYEVVSVDNYSNSEPYVYEGIEKICGRKPIVVEADCTHIAAMRRCLKEYGAVDAVIHFAASKAVNESIEKPLHYYRNNLGSLLTLLDAMDEAGCTSIVFSSSCTVYGETQTLPVTEESPIIPAASPYGNTKQICEEILRDTVAATNLNAISLRYFNPIGAHPSALIGELPRGVPQNLVPFITQTAIGIRPQLQVFGNDYATPDGSCIRDYIYVVDLAKAHVAAVERLTQGKVHLTQGEERLSQGEECLTQGKVRLSQGEECLLLGEERPRYEVFNLGTGSGLSVLELIKEFEQVTGKPLPYKIVGRRAGDIEQIWADTYKANKTLQWKANTPIRTVLASAWAWEQLRNEATSK